MLKVCALKLDAPQANETNKENIAPRDLMTDALLALASPLNED